jgi:hypothetical protein
MTIVPLNGETAVVGAQTSEQPGSKKRKGLSHNATNSKLVSRRRSIQMQEIEHNIRDSISGDSTGKADDAGIAKRKAVPQFVEIEMIAHRRSATYRFLCLVALMGMVCQIVECELLFNNDAQQGHTNSHGTEDRGKHYGDFAASAHLCLLRRYPTTREGQENI